MLKNSNFKIWHAQTLPQTFSDSAPYWQGKQQTQLSFFPMCRQTSNGSLKWIKHPKRQQERCTFYLVFIVRLSFSAGAPAYTQGQPTRGTTSLSVIERIFFWWAQIIWITRQSKNGLSRLKTTKRKASPANKQKGKGNRYKWVARKDDLIELWWLKSTLTNGFLQRKSSKPRSTHCSSQDSQIYCLICKWNKCS